MALEAIAPPDFTLFGRSLTSSALAQTNDEEVNVRVYQLASPAVVSIDTGDGSGSGSIISADGLILTNAHVVQGSETVTVILADGTEYQGDVVGFGDTGLDLAAVRLRGAQNLPTVQFASPGSVQVGQRAFAIGNPFGRFQGTLTTGIVSRVDRNQGLIQTDAAINPGNSGGPLINSQGQLIGVNTAIFTAGQSSGNIGIGFAIPVERIQPFLAAVREGRAHATAQPIVPGITKPPEAIALGASVQGQLSDQSNVLPSDNSFFNAYTFEGRAGEQIDITMTSSQLNPYLLLIAPDGTDIGQDNDSAGGMNARLVITLPENGVYTILANSADAGEVGAYSLQLAAGQGRQPLATRQQTPVQIPGVLLQEEGVLGPNSAVLQQDGSLYNEHQFEGTTGQRVVISMESDEFDTYLVLFDPDGQLVSENDDVCTSDSPTCLNSEISVTLSASGTYSVLANAYSSDGRGRYRLMVREY